MLPEEILTILEKLRELSSLLMHQMQEYVATIKYSSELQTFMHDAYNIIVEYKSDMANYWLSFMEMVEILMMNIHSLKVQDWELFKNSLRMMIPWMQTYDKNHYGKWLVEFWLEMTNLPEEIGCFIKESLFAQPMTGNPYSCIFSFFKMLIHPAFNLELLFIVISIHNLNDCAYKREAKCVSAKVSLTYFFSYFKRRDFNFIIYFIMYFTYRFICMMVYRNSLVNYYLKTLVLFLQDNGLLKSCFLCIVFRF